MNDGSLTIFRGNVKAENLGDEITSDDSVHVTVEFGHVAFRVGHLVENVNAKEGDIVDTVQEKCSYNQEGFVMHVSARVRLR